MELLSYIYTLYMYSKLTIGRIVYILNNHSPVVDVLVYRR